MRAPALLRHHGSPIWLNAAMSQTPVQHATAAQAAHDDHGSTPAAWTLVVIITLAFIVATLGVVLGNWPMFWVGVALVPVGAIVGLLMKKAGLGKKAH